MAMGLYFLSIIITIITILVVVNIFGNLSLLKDRINKLQIQITELQKRLPATELNQENNIAVISEVANATDAILPNNSTNAFNQIALPDKNIPTTSENQIITATTSSPTIITQSEKTHTLDQATPSSQQESRPASNKQQQSTPNVINYFFNWLLQGNLVAKIAIIILFLGLSYLFKYSIDHQLLSPEIRILGAFTLGLILLTFGWRLRHKKLLYALILQGGAIGDLYLTIFAAFKLYHIIPAWLAFILLIVICGTSILFAVLQHAISLAIIASVGGYLVPILLSNGSGNHIILFGYYLMISSSILIIGNWQSWRILNLIGFLFTFIVSFTWGKVNFQPLYYTECQIFIVANMLIYGILSVLLSIRSSNHENFKNKIDISLLFGTPIVAFLLQYAITKQWQFGPAISSLIFGLFYLIGSYITLRRYPWLIKTVSLYGLAIGLCFSNLAVPLAFDHQWVTMIWLIEGFALTWVMLSQQQYRFASVGAIISLFGLYVGLHHLFFSYYLYSTHYIIFLGGISVSMLFNACLWHYYREQAISTADGLKKLFIILACIMWLLWLPTSIQKIDGLWQKFQPITLCFIFATWFWYFIGHKIKWDLLKYTAVILWPILLISQFRDNYLISYHIDFNGNPWNLIWPIAFINSYFYLYFAKKNGLKLSQRIFLTLHISLFWIILNWLFSEMRLLISLMPWGFETIKFSLLMAINSCIILLIFILIKRRMITNQELTKNYWLIGLLPCVVYMLYLLLVSIFMNGQIIYWPYIPLLNPLDQGSVFALIMFAVWLKITNDYLQCDEKKFNMTNLITSLTNNMFIPLFGLTFLWFNSLVLRSLSQWLDIPWSFYSLWHTNIIQVTLSLIWTLTAMILVTVAHFYAKRKLWFTGQILQGIVVLKLIFIDSVELDGLLRAFAFIVVALLMLLIGYLAPLPPKVKLENQTT